METSVQVSRGTRSRTAGFCLSLLIGGALVGCGGAGGSGPAAMTGPSGQSSSGQSSCSLCIIQNPGNNGLPCQAICTPEPLRSNRLAERLRAVAVKRDQGTV